VGRQDAEIVANVREAKARIEEMRSGLERRRAEQVVLRNRARDAQGRMSSAVSAQKNYLAELNGEVKRLIAEEKRREAAEARARAAEAARLAAVEDSGAPGRVFDPQALGTPRPEVLSVARRFLGKTPYVWGGTTPAGFDCSGLVLYSYRELGIALPRTSRQQYLVGAFIPRHRLDLLEPGDLVFFGREGDATRVHHVALYSGGGLMIHAPQAGEYVSETSLLDRIATRRDYVGAVRP
jgi:cell wall-associated NlpC family hydrolase